MSSENMTKRSRLCGMAVVCAMFLVMCMVSCQESLQERCAREAREYTEKNCPANIGENMVLDSVTFSESGNVLGYFYSVSNELDSAELMESNEGKFRDTMKKQIRNATNLKAYKEAGFTFVYVYISASGHNPLLVLRFEEEDYK